MRTEPETTRIVRSWLEEGRTTLPDHILDAVLADLPATHQRRPLWPARRIDDMHAFAKFAMAAAAVLVVAVVGINLLPKTDGVGGGLASLTPSPTASLAPTAAPSPSPSVLEFFPDGAVSVGRHSMVRSGKTFSVDMPTGWTAHDGFRIYTQGGQAAFIFWSDAPGNVFADPCAHEPLDPPAGDTPAELAAAVSSIPGTDLVSGPLDLTVGGYPAKLVTIQVREDIACAAESFLLWYREANGATDGRWPDARGDTINVWIIDVDGTLVWIDGSWSLNTTPTLHDEMRQIVDSIRFE
jgi:hypothetical protein